MQLGGPALARRVSPILLYHSTFVDVPAQLGKLVHNVHPDRLAAQVAWLSRHFEMISVDEWFARGGPARTACITFDDGYRSVFDEAVPRLIELGVPSTIFLNGSAFRGEVFWRDRVVFIANAGLTESFLASDHARAADLQDIGPGDFYNLSRRAPWSSRKVDHATAGFLTDIGRLGEVGRYTAHEPSHLVDHPLVTYGCHTYRHYLPTSLTAAEQEEEFAENERLLDELGCRRSRVFSIPFGGRTAINDTTIELIGRFGFTGTVFSRHAMNFGGAGRLGGVPTGERYMVPDDLAALQERHTRLGLSPPNAPARRAVRRVADLVRS